MPRRVVAPEIAALVERTLSKEEALRRLSAPLGDAELEEIGELVRWFTRRYPTAKQRLAYARRKYAEWTRPVKIVQPSSRFSGHGLGGQMVSTVATPKVFVSYSYDSDEHREWVCNLATEMRRSGVDAILDQWDLMPGQDLAQFMEQGVAQADRVVLICSDLYVDKANAGKGGVGYEKMIITKELFGNIATDKFIPVIRNNKSRRTPLALGARRYVDFTLDSNYAQSLEELLRAIHHAPA